MKYWLITTYHVTKYGSHYTTDFYEAESLAHFYNESREQDDGPYRIIFAKEVTKKEYDLCT